MIECRSPLLTFTDGCRVACFVRIIDASSRVLSTRPTLMPANSSVNAADESHWVISLIKPSHESDLIKSVFADKTTIGCNNLLAGTSDIQSQCSYHMLVSQTSPQ